MSSINSPQPDEAQKVKLEEVMEKYYVTTRKMQVGFRNDFDSVTTEFKRDIDTLLTKEQLERVRELEAKNREMMQKMRREPQDQHRPRGSKPESYRGNRPDDRHRD